MTLRRKLLVAFGGLAVLALLAAAVAVYLTARWQGTTLEMREHYTRSLLLQSVRAETFQALAEVNDALAGDPGDYADARADFEGAIAQTSENFAEWRALAGDLAETAELMEVRAVYERLTAYARQVFDLLDSGRRAEAVRLVDDELDTGDYAEFQAVTERAVAADAEIRRSVTAASEDLRRTALVMSAVIAIAALSLTLLIAAYLAQDLFRPLDELRRALEHWARGETPQLLPVDRADEFGAVAAAFNRAAEAKGPRPQPAQLGEGTAEGAAGTAVDVPPHHMLNAALAHLQAGLAGLRPATDGEGGADLEAVRAQADALARAMAVSFPAALQRAPLDPRAIAQEALAVLAPLMAERGVSCECEFEPEERTILADAPRLREIVVSLLRDALAGLPERGGRIGLRVGCGDRAARLHLDVAGSGGGAGPERGDLLGDDGPEREAVHLRMARRLLAEQGGEMELVRGKGGATVARLVFPLRH